MLAVFKRREAQPRLRDGARGTRVSSLVLLAFPFSETGSQMLGSLSFLIIWLSWLFVSSFQLSGLKESMHMSGAFLSATEKAALLTGWSIGLYGRNLFVVPAALEVLSFVAVSAAIFESGPPRQAFTRSTAARKRTSPNRANRKHADHETRVLAMLRDQFDLTTREAEIALMLSRGYSRPGICSQLGISEGTVRAHSSHIYTKLGIHRRDATEFLQFSPSKKNWPEPRSGNPWPRPVP